MKTRFNTFDLICGVVELQRLVGLRVNQIYDIDNKTYLIRLHGSGEETKTVLLLESGVRFHTTAFDWPKNSAPSGFSMKLRKHLKNKRLEKLQQLGADRIVDFQFGSGEAAYHVILELYDRGNVILTDHELTILYVLRPHYEGEEVRFAVREKYPANRAKEASELPSENTLRTIISEASPGDNLRRLLMPLLDCGPAVIDHVLTKYKLDCFVIPAAASTETAVADGNVNKDGKKNRKQSKKLQLANTQPFDIDSDIPKLMEAIQEAGHLLAAAKAGQSKGYVIQKKEEKPVADGETVEDYYQNIEYHPYLFAQFDGQPVAEFDTFMLAVDEFYSTLEGQKIDVKTIQQEREALKKLSNVKKDHAKRLEELTKVQEEDRHKAELITSNQALVDNAILAIRSAIANQMSWPDIQELVKVAQANGDPVASAIKQLKLEINHIAIKLSDPYYEEDSENEDNSHAGFQVVDVDLALSAWANARKYYDQKRSAAQKEQKTIDASQKALKSAERKTQQTLKDVRTISTISKARKVYWFEKFYWFISSENYLVIGGRDAQQNELIVKRYMRSNDIYVHAEIQGASSVVVRNPSGEEVPPKTLLEAGTMAISYSKGWDAKVVTNAYWVRSDQVSKTAPTGEYLGTGSFMVRGKKNFLPSCHLIMGLSLLFKLEDSFVEKHRGERKVRVFDDENQNEEQIERRLRELVIENEKLEDVEECMEVDLDAEHPLEAVNDHDDDNIDEEKQSEDDSDGNVNFPDTQVKIEHDTGRVTVRTDSVNESESSFKPDTIAEKILAIVDEEEATIIPAAPSRKKQQQNAKKRKEEKGRKEFNEQQQKQQQNTVDIQGKNNAQMKRGQKGKLKKIKSKYRDQDEEEREMRMQILKSAGKDKLGAAEAQQQNVAAALNSNNNNNRNKFDGKKGGSANDASKLDQQQQQPTEADDVDELPQGADMEMIDALTGQPFEEDELLFVIPVVAPYQSLQNYKFKVKLTPGTGKRGRAAKTALTMFAKDKACNLREKDLLKSIREEALARNIPGKVKLSAPQMQKFKK